MDTCCGVVILILIAFGVIMLAISSSEERKKEEERRERQENERKAKRNSLKAQMDAQWNVLRDQDRQFSNAIIEFFSSQAGNYVSKYNQLLGIIENMQSTIKQLRSINASLKEVNEMDDQTTKITQAEGEMLSRVRKTANNFKAFGEKVSKFSATKMMDAQNYGRINKAYWDSVSKMCRPDVECAVSRYEDILRSNSFDEIFAIDLDDVLKCVWYFALEKNYSSADFQRADSLFDRIYKLWHSEPILASYYAKKQVGGEDVLQEPIRTLLKYVPEYFNLTHIASGLMWINAYKSENTILQHMLTTGKEMTAKTQERLHSLTNGGGKAPSGFDVKSSVSSLYFDVSALAWKDDEYIGLFENLAFQDKSLAYSLGIRDENKDLFIPQGINVPDINAVLNKFRTVFTEEYGSGVTAQAVNCIALSGSGEEKMDGILVNAAESKQMGILIHIARIGKKLIIKFYTLFLPTGSDIATQKQQALSMYKKLSPTVTMWESSLKDTMLMAVEQLLNTNAQSAPSSDIPGVMDEPVF